MIEQGTILDNTYKIVKAIGLGGGGEIYLADHLRLEKAVVIKKIRESMQGIIENRGEADILKRLTHPYLPQVYDFFIENNQVYTVMEYIQGDNFQQLLNKGKHFETKDIVKWGTQLSEVLAYLHAQKPAIIHRDIKPANVMLTPKGNVCLIDFNVSFDNEDGKKSIIAHSDGYSPLEQYGTKKTEGTQDAGGDFGGSVYDNDRTEILGGDSLAESGGYEFTEILSDASSGVINDAATEILDIPYESISPAEIPAVMPEQEQGMTGSSASFLEGSFDILPVADERSDIYSLGATLYHLISLKRPGKATEKIIPLSECSVKVSDGLIYIVEKAMRKNPEERFQSAEKMHESFLNIKKLDHEYISYAFQRDLLAGITIGLACISTICIVLGYKKMQSEEYNSYVTQVEEAIELRKQGMMPEAAEACKLAMDKKPEELTAYIEMLNVNYMQQHYAEGIRLIAQSGLHETVSTEKNSEQLSKVYFMEGECYVGLEEFDLAVGSYQKAIDMQPEQGEYYTRCAIALAYAGQQEQASQFLENAIQKGISDAAVHLTKGEIALSQGKYAEAEQSVFKVLEMTQEQDLLYHAYLTGVHLYEQSGTGIENALDKKRELLEAAADTLDSSYLLSITEKLADVYYDLGNKAEDEKTAEGYFEKALSYFEDIIKSGYKNNHILQNAALINQSLGNYLEAEKVLIEMVEEYPDNYQGYMYLTLLYSEIQKDMPLENRDYTSIFEYYDQAENKYKGQLDNGGNIDPQMQALEGMIGELRGNNQP